MSDEFDDDFDIFDAYVSTRLVSTLFVTDDPDLGPLMIGNNGFDTCVVHLADGTVEKLDSFLSGLRSKYLKKISWSEAAALLSRASGPDTD